MTTIRKISLVQYRNYSSSSFEFTAPVTCITGPNGSGKTNLLDAVYYLCYTKSYLTSFHQHTARHGTDGFRINGDFTGGAGRQATITCRWKQGKKEVLEDEIPYTRIADHIGKYAAVMVTPDDLELVNGGGEQRRKWIDGILAQADPAYLEALGRYQRTLQQRNAWLRGEARNTAPADRTALEFYDAGLSASGALIHSRRKDMLRVFIPLLQEYYRQLSGDREQIGLRYESDLGHKPMQTWLEEGLRQDMIMQRTLRGVHKDDWLFLKEGQPVKQFGSQGQKKSFLFALKFAQYGYLRQILGYKPVLLLDDIFEKLDQDRMEALLRIIRGDDFGQVLLTDTHAERVTGAFGAGTDLEVIRLE